MPDTQTIDPEKVFLERDCPNLVEAWKIALVSSSKRRENIIQILYRIAISTETMTPAEFKIIDEDIKKLVQDLLSLEESLVKEGKVKRQ